MAKPSPKRAAWPTLKGLRLLHRGKVRDTYSLAHRLRLIVTTDAISVFDFVLNALIAEKGYVLNAMSHFWFIHLEARGMPTHLVAAGAAIDEYLPPHLRGNPDLQRRAMVVHDLAMLEWAPGIGIELIARNAITGSAWKEYRSRGTIAGIVRKPGMVEGDAFRVPIFTPTTKEENGDKPLSPAEVEGRYPDAVRLFMESHVIATKFLRQRGIFVADHKGEVGRDRDGMWRIADEFCTPDGARFWNLALWEASRRTDEKNLPPPEDKQFVRAAAILMGIDTLDPANPTHVARVHQMELSDEVIAQTIHIYRTLPRTVTGMTLEEYARTELGVDC